MNLQAVYDSVRFDPDTKLSMLDARPHARTVQRDTAPKRDAAREKAKRKAARAARKRQR